MLRFQIELADAAAKGCPESVRSKGRASPWQDSIDWRGPLQPVAAIRIETWIDRISWLFILSILYIDVRQESKGRHGWQMRGPEGERLQAGGYPSENRTRLRPGAPDDPSA